ncbi:MAG TPA: DUF433 domain-containing protein [Deltaproteobacteria bacterium]|nr:DUF433 domain-containing protein [Deltaproteobacteria bacterium]
MNKYIEIDPLRCNGKPVIRGTRIPITIILDQLVETESIEKLLKKYPELTYSQVKGVLAYCHSMINHTELEQV